MTIQIEHVTEEENIGAWNDFVENNPYSTPYHLWEFGKALSLAYEYERHYLVAKDNDKIVGVFPLVFIKSRLFGNKLLSLPFCEYGGPIVDLNFKGSRIVTANLFKRVLALACSLKNVDYVEIRNPLLPSEILEREKIHPVKRYVTFRIDLSRDKENLWRSLDKKTRNSTRKAMRNNLNVYEVGKEDELKKYFSLYLKTQKKYGSPPHSFKLFRNLFKLNAEKNIKVLMAEYHAKLVAGVIVFRTKREMYWWSGVAHPKFKSLNATNLLLWKIIEWGHENDFAYLDLGRTRYGTGVYNFKKGWGGTEISLVDFVHSLKSEDVITPDPSESRYRLLTKFWSHLPIFMSRLIGPSIVKQIGL